MGCWLLVSGFGRLRSFPLTTSSSSSDLGLHGNPFFGMVVINPYLGAESSMATS